MNDNNKNYTNRELQDRNEKKVNSVNSQERREKLKISHLWNVLTVVEHKIKVEERNGGSNVQLTVIKANRTNSSYFDLQRARPNGHAETIVVEAGHVHVVVGK